MCNKAVDASLLALNFVPDWLVTNKMIEKLDNAVFTNEDIAFFDEDSEISHFLVMKRVFLL